MRVAVLQIAYTDDESMPERVERVSAMVREVANVSREGASGASPDLVVLPELWGPTGFGYTQWADLAEPIDGEWVAAMTALAAEVDATVHAGSFIEMLDQPGPDGKSLANTSVMVTAEGERTAYRKIHRFGFGVGEPALLEAGDRVVSAEIPSGAGQSTTVGMSTCYDLRFPELYRRHVDAGVHLGLVPAAWPMARVGAWMLLGRARAIENQMFVVQCNTAGTHAGTQMGGRSRVVAPDGTVLAEAGDDEDVLIADLDLDAVARAREGFPVLRDRRL